VQLDKIGDHQADPIKRIGALWVAGNLGALPGAEMKVKLAAEFKHFLFQALDFSFIFFGGGKAAEILNVALQALDLALAVDGGNLLIFFRSAHQATL
jgi:hypothetical protein